MGRLFEVLQGIVMLAIFPVVCVFGNLQDTIEWPEEALHLIFEGEK